MTIAQAIERADALKGNSFTDAQKIQMLSDCDSAIFTDIFSTHEADDDTPDEFAGYDSETDTDTVLLVGSPYDVLYIRWLHSQYDLYNQEVSRYNNTSSIYNVAYAAYSAYYNRTHLPLQSATYFKVGGLYETTAADAADPV